MFEEGQRLGVRGMVATHGMSAPTSLTVEQAQQATRLGAFIEFVSGTLATANAQAKIDRIADRHPQGRRRSRDPLIRSGSGRQPAACRWLRDVHRSAAQERVHRSGAGSDGEAESRAIAGTRIVRLDFRFRRPACGGCCSCSSRSPPLAWAQRRCRRRIRPSFSTQPPGPSSPPMTWASTNGTLIKRSSVTLPFAVQYVWQHPSTRFLYAAWSNGMQGDRHGITAFRVDTATGRAVAARTGHRDSPSSRAPHTRCERDACAGRLQQSEQPERAQPERRRHAGLRK